MSEEKEERISDDSFAYWKSLDCTKALIICLEETIEYMTNCISNSVIAESEINTTKLNQYKGNLSAFKEILSTVSNKKSLEEALIIKEDENERS
ncbi:MAG: hypothetical protein FK732_04040 [Asgard group archaeon]|nr:hypothetical protein [Asgard group archaeon]